MNSPGPWSAAAACHRATEQMTIPLPKRRGRAPGWPSTSPRPGRSVAGCRVLDECRAWALSFPDPAVGMVVQG